MPPSGHFLRGSMGRLVRRRNATASRTSAGIHAVAGSGGSAGARDDSRIAVERADQEAPCVAEGQTDVLLHLLVFVAPQRREPLGSLPERLAQRCRSQLPLACPAWRSALVTPSESSAMRLLDAPLAQVHPSQQLGDGQSVRRFLQRAQDIGRLPPASGTRSRMKQSVMSDLFLAAEQHAVGGVERAAGAAHLLVVGDDRAGRLVVDDEGQVGLVVAHAERGRRDQRLDLGCRAAPAPAPRAARPSRPCRPRTLKPRDLSHSATCSASRTVSV